MNAKYLVSAIIIIASLTASATHAQVVREDGVKSIAGVLFPEAQEFAEWTFKSMGGEILFANLEADIYRIPMVEETALSADESGGCSDEHGGPSLFYLEVIGEDGVLCYAERPAPPPGWQRDPRLACMLPITKRQVIYTLRVGLNPISHEEQLQPYYAFLLNLSIRGIATPGDKIQSAIAESQNRAFIDDSCIRRHRLWQEWGKR